MNNGRRTIIAIGCAVLAAACLGGAIKVPLWHLRMEAPQYKDNEALRVNVFAGSMSGDLREITVLNQYIGVHIPAVLPQSKWLPAALLGAAVLGIVASALPFAIRRVSVGLASVVLATLVAVAIVQARRQMFDIGHKRDAHTKLARVQDFTPPFLGSTRIAQFTVTAWLGGGAYLIGVAFALQVGAAIVSGRRFQSAPTPPEPRRVVRGKISEALA